MSRLNVILFSLLLLPFLPSLLHIFFPPPPPPPPPPPSVFLPAFLFSLFPFILLLFILLILLPLLCIRNRFLLFISLLLLTLLFCLLPILLSILLPIPPPSSPPSSSSPSSLSSSPPSPPPSLSSPPQALFSRLLTIFFPSPPSPPPRRWKQRKPSTPSPHPPPPYIEHLSFWKGILFCMFLHVLFHIVRFLITKLIGIVTFLGTYISSRTTDFVRWLGHVSAESRRQDYYESERRQRDLCRARYRYAEEDVNELRRTEHSERNDRYEAQEEVEEDENRMRWTDYSEGEYTEYSNEYYSYEYGEEEEQEEEDEPLRFFPRLPGVCARHHYRSCIDTNRTCRKFHICLFFLADICERGVGCHLGHSLSSNHNKSIYNIHSPDEETERACIQELRHNFHKNQKLSSPVYRNGLRICFKYRSRRPCHEAACIRIHICRSFIEGTCARAACKSGHDLHTPHNSSVLRRHRMAELTDGQIEDILRRKLTVRPTKGSSDSAGERPNSDAAASRQSGRPVPSANDFSEELQCPICLERFRGPCTLGCGHTLCAGCLQKVRSESGDMCPMCRAPIESIARSVTIENIISSMASGP